MGQAQTGSFKAKNYSIEYDARKLELEAVPAFEDSIVIILRARRLPRGVE